MRKGEPVTVDIEALDGEGAGVGTAGGVRVHVARALPGETVQATLAHRSPHRPEAWAELVAIRTPSADRVAPACAAYGECGGCTLEHLAYPAQRAWKRARVAEALAAHPSLADVPVEDCVPAPHAFAYRNRSKLVVGGASGQIALGAFAPRSHRLVELHGCQVVTPPLDEVAAALKRVLDEVGVAPYDERTGQGLLRHAVLRADPDGRVLAVLVAAAPDGEAPTPELVEAARRLRAARPEVIGVVENVHRARGNAIYGPTSRLLDGADHMLERVGRVILKLSATAFFQVNRDVAALLYADVAAAAGLTGTERVVDCYAGVGGLALTLAPGAAEVIGIEEHPGAVADAQASALLNHATRVRFRAGDAARELATIDVADVVVLNPPRRGCEPGVLDEVARLGPRLVLYVSCDPETLARDLAILAGRGFRTRAVRPYDMLPQTPHIEALAVVEAP